MSASPRLEFPPSGPSGVSNMSMSLARDKEAPAIVREILQNSLDAAVHAERECARVEFSLEDVSVKDIPGIKEYREAVNGVASFCAHSDWPASSKAFVSGVLDRLDEEKLPVLFVSDNGVGLNEGRMNAMLSDGIPNKKNDKATGSHGNGHFTTFNLSGLRYLLYGGVSKEDNKLMSGHAILGTHEGKTHEGKKSTCGKDGYFVTKVTHELYDPFIYPREDRDIPSVVFDKLRTIEDEHGTGALLAVLDFNYLGEKYSGGGGGVSAPIKMLPIPVKMSPT